jgi:hypothetical protein
MKKRKNNGIVSKEFLIVTGNRVAGGGIKSKPTYELQLKVLKQEYARF